MNAIDPRDAAYFERRGGAYAVYTQSEGSPPERMALDIHQYASDAFDVLCVERDEHPFPDVLRSGYTADGADVWLEKVGEA